jgi:hypothetical protein
MKRRSLIVGLLGLIFISMMTVAATAAEVKNYVFGSGPMGGPWRVGVGAGVQVLNEQLKEKYSLLLPLQEDRLKI